MAILQFNMEAKQNPERLQDQVVNAVGQVGARITDFLAGNPLETEVGKLIVVAAANRDDSEDWTLIMGICDYISDVPTGGRDALKAIRRILADHVGKNNKAILNTLTVLEAAVKNCGTGFAVLVCKNEFLEELIKLVKKETPPAVQEKVLALIQAWADAFRKVPDCADIGFYYDSLKARGIEFPATDLDALAPIVTPKRTVYDNVVKSRASQPGIYVATGAQQPVLDDTVIHKIKQDLDIGRHQSSSFIALLKKLSTFNVISDLTELKAYGVTTKRMRDRTAALVQLVCDNQALVTEILDVNDGLTNAVNMFEDFIKEREAPLSQAQDPGAPGTSRSSQAAQSSNAGLDQTNAGLNVAAFNKTVPITDRLAEEVETWLIDDKKPTPEKKDDGL